MEEQALGQEPTPASPAANGLSLASLRRVSPLHSPTRTLRLTEAEQARESPLRGSDLLARPRSNGRRSTPRRNESPMNPQEFRSASPEDTAPRVIEARRITIRPLAGSAVGTTVPIRIQEKPSTPKSRKQGPSHRKLRRWNNDHFHGLAMELARSNRGGAAAEVLRLAHEDAHLYRAIHDPAEHKSESLSRFMEDDQFKHVRNRFFEGELPGPPLQYNQTRMPQKHNLSAEDMLNRIDSRLRCVVVKACANSYPATKVIAVFENYLVPSFSGKKCKEVDGWWNEILLECPTITKRLDGNYTSQFFFDADSSQGGFHRLLLHALGQFHGLKVSSRVVDIQISDKTKARALMMTGLIEKPDQPRMLIHLEGIASP